MLKKTFGLALALILAMSVTMAFPAEAAAVTVVNYGMEGGDIYFDTVTGTVTGCDTTVTRAAIPEEIRGFAVKAIGEGAFKECGKLQSVSIPSVTKIGKAAFLDCAALKTADIPSVESIGEAAFVGCYALGKIESPSVLNIEKNAFIFCDSLQSVSFPNTKEVGDSAFKSCEALKAVEMPCATSIGKGAFSGCSSLQYADISGAESIGESAFAGCRSLKSVDIPNVERIEKLAFGSCGSLEVCSMPKCEVIGESAFSSCKSLRRIYIPKNIKSVDHAAFDGCEILADVYYAGGEDDRKGIVIGTSNDALSNAQWHCDFELGKSDANESLQSSQDYADMLDISVSKTDGGTTVTVKVKDEKTDKSAIWCFAVNDGGIIAKKLTGVVLGDRVIFKTTDRDAKIFIWDENMRPVADKY